MEGPTTTMLLTRQKTAKTKVQELLSKALRVPTTLRSTSKPIPTDASARPAETNGSLIIPLTTVVNANRSIDNNLQSTNLDASASVENTTGPNTTPVQALVVERASEEKTTGPGSIPEKIAARELNPTNNGIVPETTLGQNIEPSVSQAAVPQITDLPAILAGVISINELEISNPGAEGTDPKTIYCNGRTHAENNQTHTKIQPLQTLIGPSAGICESQARGDQLPGLTRDSGIATTSLSFQIQYSEHPSYGLNVPIHSEGLQRRSSGLFIGILPEWPPPKALDDLWEDSTQAGASLHQRLMFDLIIAMQKKLGQIRSERENIEAELCMIGRATGKSITVDLKPAILVRCRTKKCRRVLRRTILDLSYLPHTLTQNSVTVKLHPPRPANLQARQDTTKTGRLPRPAEIAAVILGILVVASLRVVFYALQLRRRKRSAMLPVRNYGYQGPAPSTTRASESLAVASSSTVASSTFTPLTTYEMQLDTPSRLLPTGYEPSNRAIDTLYLTPPIGLSAEPSYIPPANVLTLPLSRHFSTGHKALGPINTHQNLSQGGRETSSDTVLATSRRASAQGRNSDSRLGEPVAFPGIPGEEHRNPMPPRDMKRYNQLQGAGGEHPKSRLGRELESLLNRDNSGLYGTFRGNSVCGLRYKWTLGGSSIHSQPISRIGGVLRIADRLYGLTTGHALLPKFQEFAVHYLDTLRSPELGSVIEDNAKGSNNDGSAEDSDSEEHDTVSSNMAGTEFPSSQEDESWTPIKANGPIGFSDWRYIPHHRAWFDPLHKNSDFALINLSALPNHQGNLFRMPGESMSSEVVDRILDDDGLTPGPVLILKEWDSPLEGYLLPGRKMFSMFNQIIETRKVRLKTPLERGTSGTWVVRDRQFCGYIVAVYDDEPFAHIITAQKAFSDIRGLLREGDEEPRILRVATMDDIQELS